MSETQRKTKMKNANEQIDSQQSSDAPELQDFKNVTNNLVQDALTVWADLWAELEGQVDPDGQTSNKDNPFEPTCGWNEYLEKMWVLKHYLDFVKRLSQQ
jgi:hypothetical protein